MPEACGQGGREDTALGLEEASFRVGRSGRQDIWSPVLARACSPSGLFLSLPLLCRAGSGPCRLHFRGCWVSRLLARCHPGEPLARD